MDQNGIGKDINETVEKVFCRLSGREPPLFPPHVESQSEKEREETGKETEKEREESKGKKKGNSDTPLKKRKLHDINTEGGGDEGASGSSNIPAIS